ncbi:MAG: hypothetical protein Q4G64_03730 [bacterium]|nr:hypothetical protein [bacterium]
MFPRRSSSRILLATFAVVGLVRLIAIPLSPMLALVCSALAVPLLAETLWVSTDRPRSHLTRWWLAAMVPLLALDLSATLLDGEPRLLATSLTLVLVGLGQVVALWPHREHSAFAEERGWLFLYAAGIALVAFAATSPIGVIAGSQLAIPVILASVSVAAAGLLATALGPKGTGGAILSFLAVLVILISGALGTLSPAASIGAVVLGFTGQILILVAILERETREADERRVSLLTHHEWDGLTPAATTP